MPSAIGMERGKVRVVPYDARWPALFEEEAARLRRCLGANAVAIEHIGSTAVPGLHAKPVIDIMLGLPTLRAPASFYDALLALEYDHRPVDPLPDRLFFAKDSELGRTHNLSVCEAGSRFWSEHVRFRDLLRADTRLARDYVTLKQALAVRFPNDRIAYTDGKDEFVASALSIRQ